MINSIDIENLFYLGPKGSYTELAKDYFAELFDLQKVRQTDLNSIKNIIDSVDENLLSAAVLPIENSIEGIVRETIDNLIRTKDSNLRISAEMILPISHCLLSTAADKKKIKTIISHPQALAQCRNYICGTFKNEVKLINACSTADGAGQVSKLDESYAAIANEKAAQMYNLNVLDTDINDEKNNKTRFIFLSRAATKQSGQDKTSITFATQNTPGALVNVLNIFKNHEINLSYIDSRPSKQDLKEYNFYIDIDGHALDDNLKAAFIEIAPFITFFRINGSFEKFG